MTGIAKCIPKVSVAMHVAIQIPQGRVQLLTSLSFSMANVRETAVAYAPSVKYM